MAHVIYAVVGTEIFINITMNKNKNKWPKKYCFFWMVLAFSMEWTHHHVVLLNISHKWDQREKQRQNIYIQNTQWPFRLVLRLLVKLTSAIHPYLILMPFETTTAMPRGSKSKKETERERARKIMDAGRTVLCMMLLQDHFHRLVLKSTRDKKNTHTQPPALWNENIQSKLLQ